MSRKKKRNGNQEETNELWEQPIYDTEGEETYSRSQKRNKKKSNTAFLTTVLILIFLIVAIPISAGAWALYTKNNPEATSKKTETTMSSTVDSSSFSSESSTVESSSLETSETSTESSTVESQEVVVPPVDKPETEVTPTPETPTDAETEQNQATEGDSIKVLAGEGPNAVAARAGISVDELYRLNNMTPDNYFLSPGQQLRIR